MTDKMDKQRTPLLAGPPTEINLGLERFAADLAASGVAVSHVQWQPPARGNARLAALLAKLDALK